MNWNQQFTKLEPPSLAQVNDYINSPLWTQLQQHLEERYGVAPVIEHSVCSAAPGWNLKYKKGGRSLCTVYPDDGCVVCMVTIGTREAMEAELLLAGCTEAVQALYWHIKPMNGARWLMIRVDSPEALRDVKALIATRVHSKSR